MPSLTSTGYHSELKSCEASTPSHSEQTPVGFTPSILDYMSEPSCDFWAMTDVARKPGQDEK